MKILVSDTIDADGVKAMEKEHTVDVIEYSPGDLVKHIADYDAIVVRSRSKVTRDVIDAGKKLKVIARAGVGLDNVDVAYAKERGIAVVNSPDASTNAVAELTLGHMLSLARHIPRASETTRNGAWAKKQLGGIELAGKTLGLVGFGKIGKRVAELAQAFGMTVIVYDPYIDDAQAGASGVTKKELDDVVKNADFISIHTPVTPETKGLINAEKLGMMKKTAYLVNCSRGGIIDEQALYDALVAKKIAGAALDVFAHEPLTLASPLTRLDTVVFTPHLGASSAEAQYKASMTVAEKVLEILK